MKNFALILPIAAGILFGSVGVFVRILAAAGMSNATILFVRVAFAALLMLIFLFVHNRKLLKIKIRDLPIFIGTGILGMMCLNLCYNNAIAELTLSLSAVLLSTAPIFVMFLAAIIFKEKVTRRKIICMFLAIIGCVFASGALEQGGLMQNAVLHGEGGVSAIGIVFGIGSAVFYALYSIFSRLATDREYHTYTVIFYSVLLITIALAFVADIDTIGAFIIDSPAGSIVFLCTHSICTSILPYIFITLSLLYVDTGKLSILASGSEPAAAVIFGIVFFSEVPTILILIGMVITVTALILLCRDDNSQEEITADMEETRSM